MVRFKELFTIYPRELASGRWVWGECLYCKGRLARSSPDKPAISQRYADDCLHILKTRILPKHGHLKLETISSEDCESLLFA